MRSRRLRGKENTMPRDYVLMSEKELRELLERMQIALAQVELVVEGARE